MLIGMILGVVTAQAGTIVSTFGPGNSYNTGTGLSLGQGAFSGNGGYSDAFEFVPVAAGFVDKVRLAITYIYQPPTSTGSNQLNVWLMADNSGSPGAILESYLFTGPSGSTSQTIATFNSVTHPFLAAGTHFRLGAGPVDLLNSWYSWNNNDQSIFGFYAQKIGTGSWGPGISCRPSNP